MAEIYAFARVRGAQLPELSESVLPTGFGYGLWGVEEDELLNFLHSV